MTAVIERTYNPFMILACMAAMALLALAGALYRAVAAVIVAAVPFAIEHRRVLLLCLAVVAVPVAINLAWPFVVAIAGKLAVGGAGTAAFAFFTRP